MGSYIIPGRDALGRNPMPWPISWLADVLVVESWPTYATLEIRWVAWAVGSLVLTLLAAAAARRYSAVPQARALLGGLAALLRPAGGPGGGLGRHLAGRRSRPVLDLAAGPGPWPGCSGCTGGPFACRSARPPMPSPHPLRSSPPSACCIPCRARSATRIGRSATSCC